MEGVSERASEWREWLSGIRTEEEISELSGYGTHSLCYNPEITTHVPSHVSNPHRGSRFNPEKCLVLAGVGAETIINSLAALHTHDAAKHVWKSHSGKVHVGDADSEARTELSVCLCDDRSELWKSDDHTSLLSELITVILCEYSTSWYYFIFMQSAAKCSESLIRI